MDEPEKVQITSRVEEISHSPVPSTNDTRDKCPSMAVIDLERDISEGPEPGIARRSSAVALDLLTSVRLTNAHHPIHWNPIKKWAIISVYCLLQAFVQFSATTFVSVESLVMADFGGSTQAVTLGQSMFVLGNAIGPAFLGPLSDITGRKWVYVYSILAYACSNIGSALAVNLPMLVIFCFLNGIVGSVALTNVAGTIADLFGDADGAGQPMALFVVSANIGPSIGGPAGEWIGLNKKMGWRWIYYLNIILGVAFTIGMCFMPETLPSLVISRAVQKSKKESAHRKRGEVQVTVDKTVATEGEISHRNSDAAGEVVAEKAKMVTVFSELRFVTTMAFKIMFTEPIVIFLGMYNGFAYGLLFLYLDGTYDVFAKNNGLSSIDASLTFLNFGVGVLLTFAFIPLQTHLYRRDANKHASTSTSTDPSQHNRGRPEARFLTSLFTIWLMPISIFWFAFTSTGAVSFWSPLISGVVLGFSDSLLWLSMLNYVTDSYPNVAASAVAAFLIPSFWISAGLCHAGVEMFEKLSTKWGFAILGFVSFGVVGLVYVLYFFGEGIRGRSKLARKG